mmetsp:Transcript_24680/g.53851  ORF Transcript_24680/g.53851 Transcript_24680/m.53851 type:complete len:203 (+) Transcript_24680:82-690(+)
MDGPPTSPAYPRGPRPLMLSRGSLLASRGSLLATLGSLGSLLASLGSLRPESEGSCRGSLRGSRAMVSPGYPPLPPLGSLRSLGSAPRVSFHSPPLASRDIRSWAEFLGPEALSSRDLGSDPEADGRLDEADGWPAKRGFTWGARSSGRSFSIWARSVGGKTCCRCQVANSFSNFCCSAGALAQLRYTLLNTSGRRFLKSAT